MATAYEGLLNLKHSEFRASNSVQNTLSSLRDTITNYLKDIRGLNVTEEDVQKLKLLSRSLDSGYSIGTIANFNIIELENLLGIVNDAKRENKSIEKLNFKLKNTIE